VNPNQKRYSADFKIQAVKLVRETVGVKSVRQIAKDLGVSDKSLYDWVKEADGHVLPKARHGLAIAEQEELRQLRKDVRVLRMERDLLKKSIAFFIKENTKSSR
jgi:transposase